MVLLHDSKLESPLQLEFLLTEPRPSLSPSAEKSSLHPVLSPTLCFCGSSIFQTFFFCEGLSKSFKNSPGQVYFCCLPSQKEKREALCLEDVAEC